MRKHRVLYYSLIAVALVFAFGVVTAVLSIKNDYMNKFYISLAICAISLILFIIFYVQYNFADSDLKKRWMHYFFTLPDEDIDYENEINITRNNFAKDDDSQKNKIAKPNFFGAKKLCNFSTLKTGKIVYSCIVQANAKLFTPSKFIHQVLPAVVVFSMDEYYDKNPLELKNIAKDLFANKQNNVLKNEHMYFANLPVPECFTNGRQVFVSTILVYRKHLPWGGITGTHLIVPLIANPEKCSSAFIVDSLYWSKNIVANYLSEIKDISNNVADRAQGETDNIFDNLQNTDNVQQNIEDIDKENLKNDDANQIFEENKSEDEKDQNKN